MRTTCIEIKVWSYKSYGCGLFSALFWSDLFLALGCMQFIHHLVSGMQACADQLASAHTCAGKWKLSFLVHACEDQLAATGDGWRARRDGSVCNFQQACHKFAIMAID
uniref:Uncharacterized protein n=1 Tax=Micrurus paraensis TaxID=1970185 RepID=A0A2D4JV67_9SAUR